MEMVLRAANLSISRLQFIITAYHQDPDHDGRANSFCKRAG